ncbi:MAG TPA: hypothetical protein VNG13_07980 [Mycobacteriales bacterium]|nr:hypothetical protein [Mycobacteriales bacterium]
MTQLPPGWPPGVRTPGSPDWEGTAVGWLFDQCPADYRGYEVLRRHPIVLARFAAGHLAAAVEASRRGLAGARAALAPVVAPEVVDAAVSVYEREVGRLATAAHAVDLIESALRGRRYVPRL